SGPGGRIIERDVQVALTKKPVMTPLAKSMLAQGGYDLPAQGSGVRGRIMAEDLTAAAVPVEPSAQTASAAAVAEDEVRTISVKGIRKVIATRMLKSLQT